jgi:23S rRNA (cytosine1962-C5)-methyltransferase
MPRVRLRKNLARALRRGAPWVYRDALAPAPPLPDGTPVLVATGDGRPLVQGFWDAHGPIAVRALAPAAEPDVAGLVAARLGAALDRRLGRLDLAETNAFRWVHGEADLLPGIHVDVYGPAVTVRYDGAGARAFYRGLRGLPQRLVSTAAARGLAVSTVAERRRGEGAVAVIGELPASELEVRENGLRFGVDLARGGKGGLFLDQRDNRARVRSLAAGRRVLNLFGYTGGFSIYAAAGGAKETTTVDIAAPAIAEARRNFARNQLPLAPARFVAGDAFAFLERAVAEGTRFDLVIADPPSFAPSQRAVPAALRAYRKLHRLVAAVTTPGGLVCAASCSSHVSRADFLATLDVIAGFELIEMAGAAAADHPVLPEFPEGDYLKFAIGRVPSAARGRAA